MSRDGSLRLRLREVIEPYQARPDSTGLSLLFDLFILACIVVSSSLVVLEHVMPAAAHPTLHAVFQTLEIGFTAIFVVEYLLRWYAAPNPLLYPVGIYALIDLCAILPTLLMLSADLLMLRWFRGVRLLRIMRLARLVRVLKVARHGYVIYRGLVGLRIWYSAVHDRYRLRQLRRLVLAVVASLVIGANLLHVTETQLLEPEQVEQSPYHEYWKSYWHIVIVLISGIEDKEPLTLLGRVEACVLLIVGIVVVSMLTGEIATVLVQQAQRRGMVALKPPRACLEQHIVILGRNHHLQSIIRLVHAAIGWHHYILVVSPDAESLRTYDGPSYRRVLALAGDPADEEILREAAVERALRVLVLSHDDGGGTSGRERDNRSLMQTLAVYCRGRDREGPPLPITLELEEGDSLRYALQMADVEPVLGRHFGERLVSQAVLSPGITEVYDELLTYSERTSELYTVPAPPALHGLSFQQAQLHLLDDDDEPMVLVGLDRSLEHVCSSRFWLCPQAPRAGLSEAERTIAEGDHLVIMARRRPSFGVDLQEELWSGKVLARA